MSKYVSAHEYAKNNKVKLQSVYRWIRERKFKDEDVKVEKIVVERIRINNSAKKI